MAQISKLCPGAAWIAIHCCGWAGGFIEISCGLGETRRYFNYSRRDAERAYRQEFGLIGARLTRLA